MSPFFFSLSPFNLTILEYSCSSWKNNQISLLFNQNPSETLRNWLRNFSSLSESIWINSNYFESIKSRDEHREQKSCDDYEIILKWFKLVFEISEFLTICETPYPKLDQIASWSFWNWIKILFPKHSDWIKMRCALYLTISYWKVPFGLSGPNWKQIWSIFDVI